MAEHLRVGFGVAAELLRSTVRDGAENDLMLFAPAVAYSLVVSLAPLTIALSMLANTIAAGAILPDSPLADLRLTAQDLYGGLGWAGPVASVLALLFVIYGASSLFGQVARALGRIWRQPGGPEGVRAFVRRHLFALLLLAVAGLALFASAVMGNVLGGVASALSVLGSELGIDLAWLSELVKSRALFDLGFSLVLFLVAFTAVPRTRPRVKDILPGALLTAAAYAVGQTVLGFYLATSSRFSALGAFGAFLGFLVWVYYTAVIILWGAQLAYEIARYRACRRGGPDAAPYECSSLPDTR